MKLNCKVQDLKGALSDATRAVNKRDPNPIMQNVLLTARDRKLRVTGTNGQHTIERTIDAEVSSEGQTTIVAHFLTDLIAAMDPAHPVVIDTKKHTTRIEVAQNGSTSNMSIQDPEMFPETPDPDDRTIEVEAHELRRAIDKVAFAASKEDTRPILTGVKMDINEDNLVFTAADGYRMSMYTSKRDTGESDQNAEYVMVPRALLGEARRRFRSEDQTVSMKLDEDRGHIRLSANGASVTGSLLNGTPPNYSAILPESHETSVSIQTTAMLRAASSLSTLRDTDGPTIRFFASTETDVENPDPLLMDIRTETHGRSTVGLKADVEGADNKAAFNSKYIIDMLRAMEQDSSVAVQINGSEAAVLFSELPKEKEDRTPGVFKHLIMPILAASWD
ncbi:MAG: DNA polymerase III subunit beta [Dehalococcoidia bacterium]|nr:DNA polymerase III subunit beta [Dehalococcoidia bacterium]